MQNRYARAMALLTQMASAQPVRTDVPARLDRLPWSRWHWLVISAFGTLWALNGLETAVIGTSGAVLTQRQTLNLTPLQVGIAAAVYLFGAVLGAPVFGYLADVLGRRRPFLVALGLFLFGTLATALSWGFWSFAFFRFIAGIGIGGEYVTISSAVAELVPARLRGRVVLGVNGAFWAGAILGAAATIALLDPNVLPPNAGWRVALAAGIPLLFGIPLARRYIPESPRQLMVQARIPQANALAGTIESQVRDYSGLRALPKPGNPILVRPRGPVPLPILAATLFGMYRSRSIVAFSLMAAQAFLFNGFLFTSPLLLAGFHGVADDDAGIYLLGPIAGSLLGPWLLGRFFDSRGRKPLVTSTYLASAALLGITGYLFAQGMLGATTHTIAWAVVFFLASTGAAGAYLTTSELFPQEVRATALGFFFAMGSLVGMVGPPFFASLIQSGSAQQPSYGYLAAATLMAIAGLVELFLGVESGRRTLESIARPLSTEGIRAEAPRPKKGKRRAA